MPDLVDIGGIAIDDGEDPTLDRQKRLQRWLARHSSNMQGFRDPAIPVNLPSLVNSTPKQLDQWYQDNVVTPDQVSSVLQQVVHALSMSSGYSRLMRARSFA